MPGLVDFAPQVTVRAVRIDDAGLHHVTSEYTERFWLPIIGPSSWCLARLLVAQPEHTVTYDLERLGEAVGLHGGSGLNSRINRTLNRLLQFHWADPVGFDHHNLTVHAWLPFLSPRLLGRLPADLQAVHRRLAETEGSAA